MLVKEKLLQALQAFELSEKQLQSTISKVNNSLEFQLIDETWESKRICTFIRNLLDTEVRLNKPLKETPNALSKS